MSRLPTCPLPISILLQLLIVTLTLPSFVVLALMFPLLPLLQLQDTLRSIMDLALIHI